MPEIGTDIIIIGAGAAGLYAARELAASGKKIIILEARDRPGGRIHTFDNNSMHDLEAGAEFIHGNLQLTLGILKEAGITPTVTGGNMVSVENGKWTAGWDDALDWDFWIKTLRQLNSDMTIAAFFHRYFDNEKYASLKQMIKGFAEGYDGADIEKASILSLRNEWMDDDELQYRLPGGYKKIIDFLAHQTRQQGVIIHYKTVAKAIQWHKSKVQVTTSEGKIFQAAQVIITVPPAILQQSSETPGSLIYDPAIPGKIRAMEKIGNGTVIKILLLFRDIFWEENIKHWGFMFTNQSIPTWWTQIPLRKPLLTGWLGGPPAWRLLHTPEEKILQMALSSLAKSFNKEYHYLEEQLINGYVFNWAADPFSFGSYSYNLVGTYEARQELNEPVENTLFFAGEAYHRGKSQGTVEAALESGKSVAEKIGN